VLVQTSSDVGPQLASGLLGFLREVPACSFVLSFSPGISERWQGLKRRDSGEFRPLLINARFGCLPTKG
jgi:hypothetical protein